LDFGFDFVRAALCLQGGFFYAALTKFQKTTMSYATKVKNNVPVDDKLFIKPKAEPKK
jgi:hypothetical protein